MAASNSLRCLPVVAVVHHSIQRDLDVDLMVGAVDTRGVVDRIGVQPHPRQRRLDPTQLRQPEVAALANHRARTSSPLMRMGSLALSPTSWSVSARPLT